MSTIDTIAVGEAKPSPNRTQIPTRKNRIYAKGDVIFYWALLALPLLQICVFYVAVNFQSICMAFQTYSTTKNEFSWDITDNWTLFVQDITTKGFWIMIGNSLTVWLLASLCGTTLAVLFAYYIYKKYPMNNFFRFVLFLPSILPAVMLVIMFKRFLGNGIPAMMENWWGAEEVENIFYNPGRSRFWVITLFSIWIGFGSQVLVYTGAMDQIPTEQLEAAQIDGASALVEFISIILPSIFATIGTFLTMGVASLFTNQNNLFAFTGDRGKTFVEERTMGYYLYCLVYENNSMDRYCYAAFLGLACTLIVVPLALGVRKAVERGQE